MLQKFTSVVISFPLLPTRGEEINITIIKAPPILYRIYYVPQDILQNIF